MPALGNNDLTLTIKAIDEASAVLKKVQKSLDDTTDTTQKQATVMGNLKDNWALYATIAAGAGLATHSLVNFMDETINSANRLQAAMTGLNSVATAFHQNAGEAEKAAQGLAKDGLMTVADSATGLKNLLASGFNLDQAVTLMNRFKDSAAFGRQASLGFGQAISSATEGVKNGNCLVAETPVLLSTGELVPIGELYERTDAFKVYSLYADGSIKHTSVSHVIDNGLKPVYKMRLDDGKEIRATGNHRFLTTEGYKFLDDLKTTDEILTIDAVDNYNDVSQWFEQSNTEIESVPAVTGGLSQPAPHRSGVKSVSPSNARHAEQSSPSVRDLVMTPHVSVAVDAEACLPLNRLEVQRLTGKVAEARQTLRVNSAVGPLSHYLSSSARDLAVGVVQSVENAVGVFYAAQTALAGSQRFPSSVNGVVQDSMSGLQLLQRRAFAQAVAAIVGKAQSAWQGVTTLTGRVVNHIVKLYARPQHISDGERPQHISDGERSSSSEMEVSAKSAHLNQSVGISMSTTSSSLAKIQAKHWNSTTAKSSAGSATSVYTLRKSRVVSIELDGWERVYDLSVPETRNFVAAGMVVHNSILVDNAGVTKNLSVMLKEAGLSTNDLMNASTDAGVRQAIFNGILKETNAQAGDAAKLSESAAGKQAVWAAQTEVLQQKIGTALQPALLALLEVVTPIITQIADWVSRNPELASTIIIGTTALLGLVTVVGSATLAISALGPAFQLFQLVSIASISGVSTAFTAFSVLVAIPLVMPALAVAAALASIALVWNAWNEAKAAIEAQRAASDRDAQASKDLLAVAKRQRDAGKISETEYRRLVGVAANATGTSYFPGGTSLVGENGPELVNLPRGSQVLTSNQTRDTQSRLGGGSFTIGQVIVNNQADEERLIRAISMRLSLS